MPLTRMCRPTGWHHAAVIAVVTFAFAVLSLISAGAQVDPLGAMRASPESGIAGWIIAKQAMFYRALAGLIRAAKTDGSAYWGLIGISFIYGIFHAAGPGHGKAVISSYLLANEETWRRGIVLSFAAALLQAITAIVVVGIGALILGVTAKMMGDAVHIIETVGYALIVLLGVRLIWVKGRGFLRALAAARSGGDTDEAELVHHDHAHCSSDSHATHDHARDHAQGAAHNHAHDHHHGDAHGHDHHHEPDHDHAHDDDEDVLPWGHAHGPEPEELAGPGGWRRGLSAIVAVGLRPCSGAIIVLVFALAQGLFLAGVASTFVMGLGTAITVATIATLTVGARSLAARFAVSRNGYGALFWRGFETAAAILVLLFGVLLLTGTMASERMGLF